MTDISNFVHCDFEHTQLENGKYKHICKYCGYTLTCSTIKVVKFCTKNFTPEEMEAINKKAKPEMPSLIKQVANFTKAAVTHISTGMHLVTEEEHKERVNICFGTKERNYEDKCEKFVQNTHNDNGRCSECGCPLNKEKGVSSKLDWTSSYCPLKKWLAINRDQK